MRRLTQARWLQRSASEAPRAALYTWMEVSRIAHVQVLSVEIVMYVAVMSTKSNALNVIID